MKKSDNTTPHPSLQYDGQVRGTIPYYDLFRVAYPPASRFFCKQTLNYFDRRVPLA